MQAKGCKRWTKKNAVKKLDGIWGLDFCFVHYPILCAEQDFRRDHLSVHTGNNSSFFLFFPPSFFTGLYQIGMLSHTGSSGLQNGECPAGLDTIAIRCCSPAYKFLCSVRSRQYKHLHLLAVQDSEICTGYTGETIGTPNLWLDLSWGANWHRNQYEVYRSGTSISSCEG